MSIHSAWKNPCGPQGTSHRYKKPHPHPHPTLLAPTGQWVEGRLFLTRLKAQFSYLLGNLPQVKKVSFWGEIISYRVANRVAHLPGSLPQMKEFLSEENPSCSSCSCGRSCTRTTHPKAVAPPTLRENLSQFHIKAPQPEEVWSLGELRGQETWKQWVPRGS